METSDRQLIICGRWAVASDGLQWLLQHQNGSHWRNVSSVRSTRDILARCMREKGCPPEIAQRLLEAVSRRFDDAPYGRATRSENIASCTPAPQRHSPFPKAGKALSQRCTRKLFGISPIITPKRGHERESGYLAQGLNRYDGNRDQRFQPSTWRPFKLTHLGSLNQLLKAGSKTLRAMASGEIDSQLGARIMNGIGIMRSICETSQLAVIEQKLDTLASAAAEGTFHPHGQPTSSGQIIRPH
jgi:hypothetical protein